MNTNSTKPIEEIAEIVSCVPYGNKMVMYFSNGFISNVTPIINPACKFNRKNIINILVH
jgi:hypothetical protein